MFDANRLIEQLLGTAAGRPGRPGLLFGRGKGKPAGQAATGPSSPAQAGQPLGGFGLITGRGALAEGLAGMLLRSRARRRFGAAVGKLSGLALLETLAYKAFWDWQAGRRPTVPTPGAPAPLLAPPPQGSPFRPATDADQQRLGRILLRAMIMAAKADGEIDSTEHSRLFAEIERLGLDEDDKIFVFDELRRPFDVDLVARSGRTPEAAAQVYAASLLAIDVDNPAERGYLALLAARMKIDDKLVQHLHATIDTAVISKAA